MKQWIRRVVRAVGLRLGMWQSKTPSNISQPTAVYPSQPTYRDMMGDVAEIFKNVKLGAALQDLSLKLKLDLMDMTAAKIVCQGVNGMLTDAAQMEKILHMREQPSRGLRRLMLSFLVEVGDLCPTQLDAIFPTPEERLRFDTWLDGCQQDEARHSQSLPFLYQH